MMSFRLTVWIWTLTALVVLAIAYLGARSMHSQVLGWFGGSEQSGSALVAERQASRLERAIASAEDLARTRQPDLAEVARRNPDLARIALRSGGHTSSRGIDLPGIELASRTWTRVPVAGTVELALYRIKTRTGYVEVGLANDGRLRDDHGPYDLVVDRQGEVLLGPYQGNVCRLEPRLTSVLLGPGTGAIDLPDPVRGGTASLLVRPLGHTGLSLLSVFPRTDLFETFNQLEAFALLLALLTTLILLVIIRTTAQTLSSPLSTLTRAAQRISRGELDLSLPRVTGRDEVTQLRDSFQRMVGSLQCQFDEARRSAAASQRVQREFELAREIQLADPGPGLPARPEVEVFGRSLPAREVGGDVYDYFWVGTRWLFCYVADVEGKGVPAALHTVLTRRLLRALAHRELGPAECLNELNDVLNQESGRFVTVFLARLDVVTGELCYASAGHEMGLLLTPDGRVRELEGEAGLPVGIQPARYSQVCRRLEPGTLVYMATDGVAEARNPQGHFFGSTGPRLGGRAVSTVEETLAEVVRFLDGAHQQDDLTAAALVYHGAAGWKA